MFKSFSGNNGKTPADLRGSTERLCKCTSYCFSKGLSEEKPKKILLSTWRNKDSNQFIDLKHYSMPNQFVTTSTKGWASFFFSVKRLDENVIELFSTGLGFRYPTWSFIYFVVAFTLMPCNCVSLPLIKLTSNLNGCHLAH